MRAVLLAALAAAALAANDDGHRGGKPLTAQDSDFKARNDHHVTEQQLGANASIPSWRTIQEAYLDAMSAFRWTDSGPGLGMYRDSIGFDGGSGAHPMSSTFSISGTGFGLVGLCVSAKLGHTTMSRAAAELRETLATFDAHVWPLCVQNNFCPHFVNIATSRSTLVNTAEYSSIDTALFVAGAHYAATCLQPHAGATATALIHKYLTRTRWMAALPAPPCDNRCGMHLVWPREGDMGPLLPWNEYHIVAQVAAASEALGGNMSTDGIGSICSPSYYYHTCWRPSAFGTSVPRRQGTYGGFTYLSDAGNPVPDFHMAFVAMLAEEYAPSGYAEPLVLGQAGASQHYWRRVLAMLDAGGRNFNWPWLSAATAEQNAENASAVEVGEEAGWQPLVLDFERLREEVEVSSEK